EMGNLGRGPYGELVGKRLVLRQDAARLDRDRDQALLDQALLDGDVGLLEGGLDVTGGELHVIREVAAELLVEDGSARLDGRLDAEDARVGLARSEYVHVDDGRLRKVVDVAAGPGDQSRVFAPLDGGADHLGYRHCEIPPSSLGDWRRRFALGTRRHHLRRRLDRLDDVVVAGAAAEVALEPQADLLLRRAGVALEQLLGRHDHAGRTEPALKAMLVPEGLLQGM